MAEDGVLFLLFWGKKDEDETLALLRTNDPSVRDLSCVKVLEKCNYVSSCTSFDSSVLDITPHHNTLPLGPIDFPTMPKLARSTWPFLPMRCAPTLS